jgi:hypothetical protein
MGQVVGLFQIVIMPAGPELWSNLVFEACGSCGDLAVVDGLNSVFECDACDDFGQQSKPRSFRQFCAAHCSSLNIHCPAVRCAVMSREGCAT